MRGFSKKTIFSVSASSLNMLHHPALHRASKKHFKITDSKKSGSLYVAMRFTMYLKGQFGGSSF